ncbi:MAG: DUF885 domain-containing protein [Eubacterium sp.]|nr:DUF885 domain-containing protein [Eubacterium sp.]
MRKFWLKNRKVMAVVLSFAMILSMSGCGKAEVSYEIGLDDFVSADNTQGSGQDNGDNNGHDADDTDNNDDDQVEDDSSYDENIQYADKENEEFEDFLFQYFTDIVTADSMNYNSYVMYEDSFDFGDVEIVATLGDATTNDETIAEDKQEDQDFYDELLTFEDAELTEDERFTYECLKYDTEISMHYYDNPYFNEVFSPMSGLQSNIVSAFLEYRFDDKGDVEDYLEMLGQTRDYFDKLIEYEYLRSEKGYFMNDRNVDDVITQCDDMLEFKEDNVMILDFNELIDELDFLTDEEKTTYKEENKSIVLDNFLPAYEDLKAALQDLKGSCKNENGLCGYDGGKEYYENYIFPVYSGSSKTVEEEIEFLDTQLDNLLMEMTTLYYSYPEVYDEYVDGYGTFFNVYDEMGTEEILNHLQDNYMDDYPLDTDIPFEVDYMSQTMSKLHKSTLAYYNTNPVDNPDYNIIKVNALHSEGVFDTLAHEGFPGHAFQFWYFKNTNPNPGRVLERNLGYVEGWAVYTAYQTTLNCDLMGKENADILMKFNNIDTEMGYLLAERVDLGVNYEGWTFEDTKEYAETWSYTEEGAQYWFDAATGDPGIYLSYTVGYYEMMELREKAEEELGSKFVLKDFHKAVLDAGPCQFEMLEKKIDKYIAENK